ncbi:M3 family metallopeptidase [Phenylobacterium sp.]|jgi:peptidyl-dipeptidase Dcp|uniref:M3 family metallopeptidase n=1 Tax=Phenylobacterium sp. TaxID=1871053 RepID=UPI0037CCA174
MTGHGELDPTVRQLVDPWPGPYGGVPPFDLATPERIEAAVLWAMAEKRREIAAIIDNPAAPDFANTIEALEDCGRALRRAQCLLSMQSSTLAVGAAPEVQTRLAPRLEALEDEIALSTPLFARIEAVHAARADLDAEAARLVDLWRQKMIRRGVDSAPDVRARLQAVNAAIAETQSRFHRNMVEDVARYVLIERLEDLDGVPPEALDAASRLAQAKGHAGQWAIANVRPAVWAVLQRCRVRETRRRVREMWVTRCALDGPQDNRPIIAEVARLRGEKAQLHGYASFAHLATAGRMAGAPEAALDQMMRTLGPVRRNAQARLVMLQALADADGIDGPIQPWDWLYYVEQHRQRAFGLDGEAVKPYLTLDNVLAAMLDAAGRLHGLTFRWLSGVPTLHPDVRVLEVSRAGEVVGVIWFDVLLREGKMRSSWQYEMRAAETFRGRVIPLSNVCSNLDGRLADGSVVMGWEYANVLFHEFGHALHMILSEARYPSLGPMAIEWDMVELPSQLNERWLYDRDLIARHLRHRQTGEPMPDALIDGIEAAFQFDRVFSVGLEYLLPAIVDMRLYLAADGGPVDPLAIERQVYEEAQPPAAIDPIFFLPHQYHSFTDVYAAGVYAYLWADVMVADAIEAFLEAPGGLYDPGVAQRWRETILTRGAAVPGAEAFRAFRGRDPEPDALLRRFQLA